MVILFRIQRQIIFCLAVNVFAYLCAAQPHSDHDVDLFSRLLPVARFIINQMSMAMTPMSRLPPPTSQLCLRYSGAAGKQKHCAVAFAFELCECVCWCLWVCVCCGWKVLIQCYRLATEMSPSTVRLLCRNDHADDGDNGSQTPISYDLCAGLTSKECTCGSAEILLAHCAEAAGQTEGAAITNKSDRRLSANVAQHTIMVMMWCRRHNWAQTTA